MAEEEVRRKNKVDRRKRRKERKEGELRRWKQEREEGQRDNLGGPEWVPVKAQKKVE